MTMDSQHGSSSMSMDDPAIMDMGGDHSMMVDHSQHMPVWSDMQQKHLSVWPHFTGVLSMIGSGLIIFEVLRDPKKRQRVYHRLLLAMSICDFNTSFWYFLSTWPIPRGTSNVFAPSGTQASCTAQGFFMQFGIATPLYNAALAFYYLLIIRYQWKEERMKKAEKYFHALPLLWAASTSFAALGLAVLGCANLWCWIVYWEEQFQWIFFLGPLWATMISSAVSYFLTYLAVVQTEMASAKWKSATTATYEPMNSEARKKKEKEESDRKHSKQVSTQAFYYLLAFFLTWTPITIHCIFHFALLPMNFPLQVTTVIFTPMQGFLRYLVYMRPRWISYRKRHPEWGRCMAFAMIFRGGLNKQTETSAVQGTTRRTYFSVLLSVLSGRTSASRTSRRSSDSRRSSNDVGSAAKLVSEEYKEKERPHDDDVDPKVMLGCGDDEEESPSGFENGTSVDVTKTNSIFSSVIPDESSLRGEFEDDKKVHFVLQGDE